MTARYGTPEMEAVWSREARFQRWLDVELAACRVQHDRGVISDNDWGSIRERAAFDIGRVDEIEAEVNHEVIAFLTAIAENVGPASRFIHLGMTSSDVIDTALALQLRESADILIAAATTLRRLVGERSILYRDTVMVGRTHGIHAEPMTLGLKLAVWFFELGRDIERLRRARETISYGKLSGAVGTYANLDPQVELDVCHELGLEAAEASTQVIQRDRHAEYLNTLALLAASLEKFATEVRNLQRTDNREVEEPFAKGQKGSSAMPHKRNPIICERVTGLARKVRANALAGLETVALWHERDLSNSSIERLTLPESSTLLHYMLVRFTAVVEGLIVYPERMMENLERSKGLVFSQRLLLALVEKGMSREDAYAVVQDAAMKVWRGEGSLRELAKADERAAAKLSAGELDRVFDLKYFLRNTGVVFERLERELALDKAASVAGQRVKG